MKVVAKKSLMERIIDDVAKIEIENLEVDYIELTEAEAKSLRGKFQCECMVKRFCPEPPRLLGHSIKIVKE